MKRSKKPTPYLLIKANTMADFDPTNYAIIHIDQEWLDFVHLILQSIEQYKPTKAFHCFSYWDAPLGYYHITEQVIAAHDLMPAGEDKAFIQLDAAELAQLQGPEDEMEAQQLLITENGIAHYKGYAKWVGTLYWTEEFNLKRLVAQLKR